jgi:hypothetical protein
MKRTIIIYALILLSSHLFAQVELGGTTDYTEVEADGTIEFHGEASVWNDFVVPMSVAKTGNYAPSWSVFKGGIHAYLFENDGANSQDEVEFIIQLPHDWDGSAIYPHLHWAPENDNSGAVVWGMEYTWVNYDPDTYIEFPNTITITSTSENLNNNGLQHVITDFGSITPSSDQNKISSILLIRLFRKSGDGADTYGSGAFGLSFDIHYRSNTVGSRQEYIK